MFVVLVLHFHLDPLELIDWLIRVFLFLPLSLHPPFLFSFCSFSSFKQDMFNWYFSQSKSRTPISVLSKLPPLQSGNDSTLSPSKSQAAVWEQRVRGWRKLGPTAKPDLGWTSCGRGGLRKSCSSLQVSAQCSRFQVSLLFCHSSLFLFLLWYKYHGWGKETWKMQVFLLPEIQCSYKSFLKPRCWRA